LIFSASLSKASGSRHRSQRKKGGRTVALALDAPTAANTVATIANAKSDDWTLLNATTSPFAGRVQPCSC